MKQFLSKLGIDRNFMLGILAGFLLFVAYNRPQVLSNIKTNIIKASVAVSQMGYNLLMPQTQAAVETPVVQQIKPVKAPVVKEQVKVAPPIKVQRVAILEPQKSISQKVSHSPRPSKTPISIITE